MHHSNSGRLEALKSQGTKRRPPPPNRFGGLGRIGDRGRVKSLAPAPDRLDGWFRTLLRRRHGIPYNIDFDRLARCLNLSRRSIERGVAKLRAIGAFNFLTFRDGRSYAVKVSDRHRSIKGVFPLKREKKETRPNQSSGAPPRSNATVREGAGSGPPTLASDDPDPASYEPQESRVAALAACLARGELADLHWDNCKITWRFAHAFRFARRSLNVGHQVSTIVKAYDAAVHQRHKDATDYALERGCQATRWEPSSSVTLAAEILRQDGRTVGQRWRAFFNQPRREITSMITSTPPSNLSDQIKAELFMLRAKVNNRPRGKPAAGGVTLAQLARFLERKEITLAEFNAMPWAWRQSYVKRCAEFFSSATQTQK